MKRVNDLFRLIGMILLAAAVYQEMKKPPEERTWHGTVVDFVPYEFRAPTLERVKSRIWNPADPRIFTPTIFGVGWTINLASLCRRMEGACSG